MSVTRSCYALLRLVWRLLISGTCGVVVTSGFLWRVVYNVSVFSVREDLRRLIVLDHRCLRSLTRVWWHQYVSNDKVLGADCGPLGGITYLRWLRWLGHVLQMSTQCRLHRARWTGLDVKAWQTAECLEKESKEGYLHQGLVVLAGWNRNDTENRILESLTNMARHQNQRC